MFINSLPQYKKSKLYILVQNRGLTEKRNMSMKWADRLYFTNWLLLRWNLVKYGMKSSDHKITQVWQLYTYTPNRTFLFSVPEIVDKFKLKKLNFWNSVNRIQYFQLTFTKKNLKKRKVLSHSFACYFLLHPPFFTNLDASDSWHIT